MEDKIFFEVIFKMTENLSATYMSQQRHGSIEIFVSFNILCNH